MALIIKAQLNEELKEVSKNNKRIRKRKENLQIFYFFSNSLESIWFLWKANWIYWFYSSLPLCPLFLTSFSFLLHPSLTTFQFILFFFSFLSSIFISYLLLLFLTYQSQSFLSPYQLLLFLKIRRIIIMTIYVIHYQHI